MPFNSLAYFLFLPSVFLVFHSTPHAFRWSVLLAASLAFYACLGAPHLIAALLLVTTISYFAGIRIGRDGNAKARLYCLVAGVAVNLLVLVLLKYLPFLTAGVNALESLIAPGSSTPVSKVIVSTGVSYFVLQAISYLVDIYMDVGKPERHFGYLALYMSFFPKLIQGPLERAESLLPQLKQSYVFRYDNVRTGMLMFTWGLFKKVVIADRLAIMVNSVYDNVHAYQGLPLLLATYAFALQIYFDFSGYTDMALGTARIFNIHLTRNFNNPYFATSIPDFWRRWHVSFSRWILDYIYMPLQVSLRKWGNHGVAVSLAVTFFLSGIWHGASYGFIVWGLLHGTYLAASVYYAPMRKRVFRKLGVSGNFLTRLVGTAVTFHLVCLAWVFFRASSIPDAVYVISHVHPFGGSLFFAGSSVVGILKYVSLGLPWQEYVVLVPFAGVAILVDRYGDRLAFFTDRLWLRWAVYVLLCVCTLSFRFVNTTGFLYARF